MTRARAVATALALGVALARGVNAQPAQAPLDDLRRERTRGSPSAPVTMYEMSDFQCPWCAQFWRETLPAIEREYVATGQLRLIFVNMPNPQLHPNAEAAAELAMCAARQHRFWQMHDLLFRLQDRWADLAEPGPFFLALGDSVGANHTQLLECVRSGAMRSVIESDFEGGRRSGARSTPAFYIEGGLVVGSQPFALFKSVLDSILRTKTR
jgi:protein-disulfide isomerase